MVMSIGQKQRLSSLRFYLYDRPLHPELFDIYHDHHVVKAGWDAQIWVTGCAHSIGFYRDEYALVETVAEASDPLPQRGVLLDLPVRGERDHQRRRVKGINYMMNLQVEIMSPEVYSKTHHDLARTGARRGLFVPFPMWMSRQLTPFTFIDYEAKPHELHVFAFHAFPDELTLVKTQSIFELG
jgi:hypothetical protein